MSLWTIRSRIVINCGKGITPLLSEEIISLGLPILSEGVAHVETEGTMVDAVRLNLLIRTGHRVLFLLQTFRARNPDALYKEISEIEWENYVPDEGYICVTSTVDTPTIQDSRFANLKCKDAIVDRVKRKCGHRPDSGPKRDRSVVHLYWKDEVCLVYLDTSGEPLSRRGYRRIPLVAPMQETLAAAVVLATGWKGDRNFINPMCGSGTLAIEAALIALERAPGLLRNNYGFMHLKGFDESSWKDLRKKARAVSKKNLNGKIIATDISPEAIEAAKKNAATAGVEQWIEFRACDFSETPIPEGGGAVILNPEYGERMGKIEELKETYERIGDFFKKKCGGYVGYIFTGNLDLAKKVGLKTKRRIPLFNGPIECRLLEYDLYEGSRKRQATNFKPCS
ncbi:MAG: class I SAM-dependent RNA methyltransferase [Thermodesulfobacteriota bacterium]|jgi:putative N6-adenine-specific DNA methylase